MKSLTKAALKESQLFDGNTYRGKSTKGFRMRYKGHVTIYWGILHDIIRVAIV